MAQECVCGLRICCCWTASTPNQTHPPVAFAQADHLVESQVVDSRCRLACCTLYLCNNRCGKIAAATRVLAAVGESGITTCLSRPTWHCLNLPATETVLAILVNCQVDTQGRVPANPDAHVKVVIIMLSCHPTMSHATKKCKNSSLDLCRCTVACNRRCCSVCSLLHCRTTPRRLCRWRLVVGQGIRQATESGLMKFNRQGQHRHSR